MKANDVVQRTLREWTEYDEGLSKTREPNAWKNTTRSKERDTPAAVVGATKICVASEIQGVQGGAGLGLLLTNDHGCVKLAMAEIHDNIQNPCIAKLGVVRRALVGAQQMRIQIVVIWLDVKTIVAWL